MIAFAPFKRFANEMTFRVPSVPSTRIRSRTTCSMKLYAVKTPTRRQYLSAFAKDPSSKANTFRKGFSCLREVNLVYL